MTRFSIDPERSTVDIEGSSSLHPIRARSKGLNGWFELSMDAGEPSPDPGLEGEVAIPVHLLASGNPLVDRETRRRVDAERHPEITGRALTSTRVDAATMSVTGTITFRGETREVSGVLGVARDRDDLLLSGSGEFDLRDWGLRMPRLGLLKVHPEVTVTISLRGSPS